MKGIRRVFIMAVFSVPGFLPLLGGQAGQEEAGRVAASFLEINPSVRLAAMGGHQAAAQGQFADMSSNPAGILSAPTSEFWISQNQSFENTRYLVLGFGVPFKGQALSFLAESIDEGRTERVELDSNNDPIPGLGDFRWSTTLAQLSYARPVFNKLSVGVTAKAWQENRDQTSAHGWAADAGAFLPFSDWLDFGLTYRNLGPSVEGYELPTELAAGAAFHLHPGWLAAKRISLFSELNISSYRDLGARVGTELAGDFFWLRAGYQNITSGLEDPLSQFAFGGGMRIKGWKLDYTWEPKGELGDQHRIALTLAFGLSPEERAKKAKELDAAMEKRMAEKSHFHYLQGEAARQHGDWELAISHYSQALIWQPQHKEAREKIKLAEEKRRLEEANRLYEDGRKLASKNEWLEAALKWQQTLKLVPTHEEARRSLKSAHLKINSAQSNQHDRLTQDAFEKGVQEYLTGRYDPALKEWNKVLSAAPQHPHIREYIKEARNKKLEEELAQIKKSKKPATIELEAFHQQAYTLFMLGKTERAILIWEKLLLLDPENEDAKAALRTARAKQVLTKTDPGKEPRRTVDELNSNAMRAYGEGYLDQAVTLWRRALQLDPRNQRIEGNLRRVEGELATTSGRMEAP